MGKIKVKITDQAGGKMVVAEVSDDIPMERLLPLFLKKMQIPSFKSRKKGFWDYIRPAPLYNQEPYSIQHKQTRRLLRLNETLASAGIREGDTLRLLPNIAPGTPNLEEVMTFISGKKFNELAVVIALQMGDLVTAFVLPKELSMSFFDTFVRYQLAHRKITDIGFPNECVLINETKGTAIDLRGKGTVGDFMESGDFISVLEINVY